MSEPKISVFRKLFLDQKFWIVIGDLFFSALMFVISSFDAIDAELVRTFVLTVQPAVLALVLAITYEDIQYINSHAGDPAYKLLSTLQKLAGSRKFWLTIINMVFTLGTLITVNFFSPAVAQMGQELTIMFQPFFISLVGMIAGTDGAEAWASTDLPAGE